MSVELGYVFRSLRLQIASMSSALLSVLLVCNRRILRHRGKFSKMLCSCPHVRHFVAENQTVCPTLKKKNHGLPLCQNNVNCVYIKTLAMNSHLHFLKYIFVLNHLGIPKNSIN
jgi:hypothetical protein